MGCHVRMSRQLFKISPPSHWPLVSALVIVLFMGGIGGAFGYLLIGTSTSSVSVSEDGVEVDAPLYGDTIARSDIDTAGIRVVNLDDAPRLDPESRKNGLGLPGLRFGWYLLGSGERALSFVTEREGVVYVPTSRGYALLLSAEDPEGLADALRGSTPR